MTLADNRPFSAEGVTYMYKYTYYVQFNYVQNYKNLII